MLDRFFLLLFRRVFTPDDFYHSKTPDDLGATLSSTALQNIFLVLLKIYLIHNFRNNKKCKE